MTRFRTAILVLVTLGFFFCQFLSAAPPQKENVKLEPIPDSEEYAVYSALLTSLYASIDVKKLVINDWTPSPRKQQFIGFIGGLTPVGAKLTEIQPETSADFAAKCKESFELERKFAIKLPYILVAEKDLKAIFRLDDQGRIGEEPWQEFYKKYPGAGGIISLSRVGFNKAKDQAAVYITNQTGIVGGSGAYYLLSKHDGSWKIEKMALQWMS